MKTLFYLIVCVLFGVTSQNLYAQDEDWEILLDEQFNGSTTQFLTGSNSGLEGKLVSGRYILSYNDIQNPNFSNASRITTDLQPSDDYMIELSLTLLEGGYNEKTETYKGFGLVWGFSNWDNYLGLLISSDGERAIYGKIAGSSIDIRKWGRPYDGYINKGNSLNKITLIKENKYFKIFYNNYYEGKLTDYDISDAQDLMGNKVGFYIPNGCKIAVDYITVKRKSIAMKNAIEKYQQKNYTEAVLAFSNIVNKANFAPKTVASAYTYRAACYVQQNLLLLAMTDVKKAIQIDPSNQSAHYIKGYIHYQQNESEDALESLYKSGDLGKELIAEITNPTNNTSQNTTSSFKSSGSGFALSSNGYIATNWHVVEDAKNIVIQVNRNGEAFDYKAKLIYADKTNDLAILKIDDTKFNTFGKIPYTVKKQMLDVGTSIFAMGYPLLSSLGEEVKLTDGLISSKTGYQGDIVTYQISAPIQPGNSGGPLFDKKGNLVGITNAGIPNAENVGYAIKANYLINLLEMLPETIQLPTVNTLQNIPFTSQVKELSKFVFIIKVQ
jgi:S1-C subfamily serine protease